VRIPRDGVNVVEDERPAKAVVVGGGRQNHQEGGGQPALPLHALHIRHHRRPPLDAMSYRE
jgi:hypothetical protein